MIAIVNIDKTDKLDGEQLYSVRINQRELFQFKHKREELLSECLRKAQSACFRYELKKEKEVFGELNVNRQDW